MSDATFQRSLEVSSNPAASRPLPVGYGLALGAVLSLGLWAGLIWFGLKLFV
jgi:hypothetical protein